MAMADGEENGLIWVAHVLTVSFESVKVFE